MFERFGFLEFFEVMFDSREWDLCFALQYIGRADLMPQLKSFYMEI